MQVESARKLGKHGMQSKCPLCACPRPPSPEIQMQMESKIKGTELCRYKNLGGHFPLYWEKRPTVAAMAKRIASHQRVSEDDPSLYGQRARCSSSSPPDSPGVLSIVHRDGLYAQTHPLGWFSFVWWWSSGSTPNASPKPFGASLVFRHLGN